MPKKEGVERLRGEYGSVWGYLGNILFNSYHGEGMLVLGGWISLQKVGPLNIS